MSPNIFELIQTFCSDGVEYRRLGDLGAFFGGLNGKTKNDFVDGNAKFVPYKIVYDSPFVDLSRLEYVRIGVHENQRSLQYGDVIFTGSSETRDECGLSSVIVDAVIGPLYLNSFCFAFRFTNVATICPRFMAYLFRSFALRVQIVKTASGTTRFNVSKERMKKIAIPVPPLPVQQEIVRILDTFDTYRNDVTAGLAGELAMRRKQFQYWQEKLLSFDDSVPRKALGEVAVLERGKPVAKQSVGEGTVPVIAGGQQPAYYCAEPNRDGSVITVAGSGAYAGFVSYWDEPIFVSDAFSIVGKDEINTKFLYYYLKLYQRVIYGYKTIGGIPHVHISHVDKMSIPIPPLAVQQEIVRVLDVFVELERELERELELRVKQFEYYRDHLLAFPEKKGA